MEIYSDGTAIIQHVTSGVQYEIDADELDWEITGSSDRGMGEETIYEARIEHPELGLLMWG